MMSLNRRGLLGGVSVLALITPKLLSAASAPPPVYGPPGRGLLGVIGDGSAMLDVSQHGVIADGQSKRYHATYAKNSNAFAFFTTNYSTTVTNSGGNAVVTIVYPSALQNDAFPQFSDIGALCHVPGAGTSGLDFVSPILFTNADQQGQTVSITLRDPAPTTLTAAVRKITWPCFQSPNWSAGNPAWTSVADDTGKGIWINQGQTWKGVDLFKFPIINFQAAVWGVIGSITSPSSVTITYPTGDSGIGFTWPASFGFGFPVTNRAGVDVCWGTDNSPAILAAANLATQLGITDLYFPGPPTAIVCGFNCYTPIAGAADSPPWTGEYQASLPSSLTVDTTALFSNTRWLGDGVTSRLFSIGGVELAKRVAPRVARPYPVPRPVVNGKLSFPRLNSLSPGDTCNVVVISASIYSDTPQPGQPEFANDIYRFLGNMRNRNPHLNFTFTSRAVGGSMFSWMDDHPPTGTGVPNWYTVLTNPWFSYCDPITINGSSSAHGDLFLVFDPGNNGSWRQFPTAFLSILRKWIATVPTRNGHLPDVMVTSTRSPAMMSNTNSATPAGQWPGLVEGCSFVGPLHVSMAQALGIGCHDTYDRSCFMHRGWSPIGNTVNTACAPPAQQTNVAKDIVPYNTNYEGVRNWAGTIITTGTSGAAAWTTGAGAVKALRVQLSAKFNNQLRIGVDPGTGNLTAMVTSWGRWMKGTLSLNSSTGVLTDSGTGQRVITGVSWFGDPISISVGAVAFNQSTDINQGILVSNGAENGAPFVTSICEVLTGTLAQLADPCNNEAAGSQTGTTITIGGLPFIQKDADAQHNIFILNIATQAVLQGKITGYTSTGVVTTDITGTTLSGVPCLVFVGFISEPHVVTDTNVVSDVNPDPIILFGKNGYQVEYSYNSGPTGGILASTKSQVPVWSSNRACCWGGKFSPRIFVEGDGPCTMSIVNMTIDAPVMYTPALTDRQVWGTPAGHASGGGSVLHPSDAAERETDEQVMPFNNYQVSG